MRRPAPVRPENSPKLPSPSLAVFHRSLAVPTDRGRENVAWNVLSRLEVGQATSDELLPLVYDQLRQLAAARMASERPDQTLQATALVHEAFLRVAGSGEVSWDSRASFFAAAAEAMRRIMIESACRRNSQKRGGDRKRVPLDEDAETQDEDDTPELLLELEAGLQQLAEVDSLRNRLRASAF